MFSAGKSEEAVTTLQRALADPIVTPAYRVNIETTLAMVLVRSGRYQEALKIVDVVDPAFRNMPSSLLGPQKSKGASAVYSSIRACALNGLGRTGEALAVLKTIPTEPSTSSKASGGSNDRLLAFSCMHDAVGLANELATLIPSSYPAADVFLQFQVGRETVPAERDTLAAALRQDTLVKAMAGRVRRLDESFAPALSGWKSASSPN